MAINIVHDLTTVWTGDAAVTFAPETMAVISGFQREGTGNFSLQVSNELIETWRTAAAFSLVGKTIYMWMVSYGQLDTYALGGIGIVLGDGTNTIAYYTGGKDRIPFQAGGWQCHTVDASNPPPLFNEVAGLEANLNFGAITQVGVRFKTLAKSLGGAVNCFTDVCRYGTGIRIAGGTSASPASFYSASQDDFSTDSGKAYGIIRELQPGVFGVQGRVDIGDTGSVDSYFADQDSIVIFEDWGAGDNSYSTTVRGGAAGTNVIKFGQSVGSGDTVLGANGLRFQSSGPDVRFSWSGSDTDVFDIYGTTFFKIVSTEPLHFSQSGSNFVGNVIDQCTQIDVGSSVVRNCTFSGTVATSGSLLWAPNINIAYCAFNNNTIIGTNPPNVNAGIYVPNLVGLDYITFNNLSFTGNTFDVLSAYTGTLTIASTDSNISSYTASYPATGDVNIINNVFLTVNVEDKNAISIASASVWIATDEPEKTRTVLMNEYTTAGGVAIEDYNYLGDQEIIVRVRKSSPGSTRYTNIDTVGLIDNGGYTTTIVMQEDINADDVT